MTRSWREFVCVSSSLIARRTEFIHETNRIRGDYDTGISQFLGSLGNSHISTHEVILVHT